MTDDSAGEGGEVRLDWIAARLRQLRQDLEMRQEDAARAAGMTAGMLSDWELGKFGAHGPSLAKILRLLRVYGVGIGSLDRSGHLEPGYAILDQATVDIVDQAHDLKAIAGQLLRSEDDAGVYRVGMEIPRGARVVTAEEFAAIRRRVVQRIRDLIRRERGG